MEQKELTFQLRSRPDSSKWDFSFWVMTTHQGSHQDLPSPKGEGAKVGPRVSEWERVGASLEGHKVFVSESGLVDSWPMRPPPGVEGPSLCGCGYPEPLIHTRLPSLYWGVIKDKEP